MKKINWKLSRCGSDHLVSAQIGCVYLSCQFWDNSGQRQKWRAFVRILGSGILGRFSTEPMFRQSLSNSKEDAIQLARELLSDIQDESIGPSIKGPIQEEILDEDRDIETIPSIFAQP